MRTAYHSQVPGFTRFVFVRSGLLIVLVFCVVFYVLCVGSVSCVLVLCLVPNVFRVSELHTLACPSVFSDV